MVTSAGDWGVVVANCSAYDTLAPEKQVEVIDMAVDYLWNWTGRVFGINEVTVRPCREGCTEGYAGAGWSLQSWSGGKMLPVLVAGAWMNVGCGTCGYGNCSCDRLSEIALPGPIDSITEVLIDGVALPTTAYRVDNDRLLVRTDGERWPACQSMSKDLTEAGTFGVTYKRGAPVPPGGRQAAETLACQFAKSINQPRECALPQRIQNITRQGVTVTLMDDFKTLADGGTGIWLIDSWVASVTKAPRVSTVRSPDIPHPRRRTTTWRAP